MKRIIVDHPQLVAFWDFQEEPGQERVSQGPKAHALQEGAGEVARDEDGVFGPYSARLDEGKWFFIPRMACPELNIAGPQAQVTIAAWVKRGQKSNTQCEFVAGMWNETNKKRQYGLFLNLYIWESSEQVCGHVSSIGGPTPGHRWCMDASIGSHAVPRGEWQFVAFTYDGEYARSYLNGILDEREGRNPYPYPGGLYDGGEDGADFTVGAVDRLHEIGNYFVGSFGGLAIYNKALSANELSELYAATLV
ncbi:LamG domain-containing protein [Paenibacillus roseipurpureus]|uniref:LamG domain-containing protein n=1 Tax=Paenibacillus roseopurpureus TaxID=2918901 RepID=A0AA96RI79_9BACL|nr:LamG domain-containing protein [Paenibacillus sp. MBLB1832]WNR44058.1 LamG domain-containing protein [Paenibacillus sp. MBLB1832]